ncbi:hypothetical protein RYX36_005525 [Vicia faba]
MTYEITSCAVFGKRTKHQHVFKTAMEEIVSLLGGFCIADLYPSIKVLLQRVSRGKTRFEKLCRDTDRILQDIIKDHKSNYRDEDLVDVLLKLQQDNHLTDDNIRAVIQDLFSAAGIVSWAMSEMVKNPKVMEEAQAEIRRVFDKKGLQEVSVISVLKEALNCSK